ncbi:L-serine ammonia-lyase, iron-sulfur-dependent, subunit alpha [Candidatus Enterococcus murrayae]|uniref:L-serine ammonia-lyase n=1 Tax=Candidatus Enterococcus murrayae TaxID=2815321 RepID=A0ABS3HIV5_9ENTE|nr:L-serine ammonia-lyase, iron-sulfur-dependent, subunit alpha [Enterococcus sp. MJM16]MBO0453396.1 L-serine ammonia-lyase, iron-sulfur-dependent, subunit alpha [Enterococcus sp. MJM16]
MKEHASIFNDVLGPVMIGPSSSHTAASVRIGRALRQMVAGKITYFQADFDPEGSLAASYITQCSDIGLVGGLLGMDPTDSRLTRAITIAEDDGMEIVFRIVPYENDHPNTYKMTIKTDLGEELEVVALSVGGGMIEIPQINHFAVEVTGGFYETLLFGDEIKVTEADLSAKISKLCSAVVKQQAGKTLLHLKTQQAIPDSERTWLNEQMTVERFIAFDPVLPVMSQKEPKMLFSTAEEMIALAKKEQLDLADMALRYESHRGSISEEEVYKKAEAILEIMENGIKVGLAGTSYDDRMLGSQAPKIQENRKKLIGDDLPAKIIENISALMEVKSSMNVFVAAPTAGSCGALPGTLVAVSDYQKKSHDDLVRALLAAGMIGVFIAEYATFAAEVAGCQAECGSGAGMTAGALVQLMGGTIEEAVDAASMALQNIFGMVCDPIGVRVEVPCLGKNMMCGMNALGAANMALAGYDVVVPLDETIESFNKVGRMIPPELRCTGHAGLAQTPSGLAIAERLGCPLDCC